MSGLQIVPLRVGTVTRVKAAFNFNFHDSDKTWESPIVIWYIEGASSKILVDTGGSHPQTEISKKYRYPYTRTLEQEPVNALKSIGVSVDDIDIVINTHLHWDHCYNNHLFKNATFVVQKKELEFAIAPIPTQENVYESIALGMTPPWFATKRWEVVDGDEEIAPGVSVIFTPGHTKGIQSVLVATEQGPYLIAGDTIPLFENWKGKHSVPNGIHVDLEVYFQTLRKIYDLNAVVLPGHDTAIFNSAVYPSKSAAAAK